MKCLLFLFLLAACGKSIAPHDLNSIDLKNSRLVASKSQLWPKGSELNVLFLDGDSEEREFVSETAVFWSRYGNIQFKFFKNKKELGGKVAHIRITFKGEKNSSLVGRSSSTSKKKSSMSLGRLKDHDYLGRKIVLHEFGHALGLLHEHQHPDRVISLSRVKTLIYCKEILRRSKDVCMKMIINTYSRGNRILLPFDNKSVMNYRMHNHKSEIEVYNTGSIKNLPSYSFLSLHDRIGIFTLYPKLGMTEDQIKIDYAHDMADHVKNRTIRNNCRVIFPEEREDLKTFRKMCKEGQFGIGAFKKRSGQIKKLHSNYCGDNLLDAIDELHFISSDNCGVLN
jgi:hypothetical protein